MSKKEEKEIIEIPEIKIKEAVLTIVGDSPLLIHKFSEKAKAEILNKQMKKAKAPKEAKVPFKDFMMSLHWITPMPDIEKETDEEKLGVKYSQIEEMIETGNTEESAKEIILRKFEASRHKRTVVPTYKFDRKNYLI